MGSELRQQGSGLQAKRVDLPLRRCARLKIGLSIHTIWASSSNGTPYQPRAALWRTSTESSPVNLPGRLLDDAFRARTLNCAFLRDQDGVGTPPEIRLDRKCSPCPVVMRAVQGRAEEGLRRDGGGERDRARGRERGLGGGEQVPVGIDAHEFR